MHIQSLSFITLNVLENYVASFKQTHTCLSVDTGLKEVRWMRFQGVRTIVLQPLLHRINKADMKGNLSETAPMPTLYVQPHPEKCCNNLRPIWACVSTGQGLALSKGRTHSHCMVYATHKPTEISCTIRALPVLHFILQDMFTQRGHGEDDYRPNNPCLHCATMKT